MCYPKFHVDIVLLLKNQTLWKKVRNLYFKIYKISCNSISNYVLLRKSASSKPSKPPLFSCFTPVQSMIAKRFLNASTVQTLSTRILNWHTLTTAYLPISLIQALFSLRLSYTGCFCLIMFCSHELGKTSVHTNVIHVNTHTPAHFLEKNFGKPDTYPQTVGMCSV